MRAVGAAGRPSAASPALGFGRSRRAVARRLRSGPRSASVARSASAPVAVGGRASARSRKIHHRAPVKSAGRSANWQPRQTGGNRRSAGRAPSAFRGGLERGRNWISGPLEPYIALSIGGRGATLHSLELRRREG